MLLGVCGGGCQSLKRVRTLSMCVRGWERTSQYWWLDRVRRASAGRQHQQWPDMGLLEPETGGGHLCE